MKSPFDKKYEISDKKMAEYPHISPQGDACINVV